MLSCMGAIYILSKLGGHGSLFPLRPLSFRIFFRPLQYLRIAGNAEERPVNVKVDAQANGGITDFILDTAFLFNIICRELTAYLTYCRLFAKLGVITSESSVFTNN